MHTLARPSVKVADEVWIAIALLHRENPKRSDFTVTEIVERAQREGLHETLRPGVRVHALLHCVANRAPNPGRYRMLFATGKVTRRLFRTGDSFHPGRRDAKIVPNREDIPDKYHYLLDWYFSEYSPASAHGGEEDPLLALRGSGKHLWADEHADEYVRRLREGWE